MIPNSVFHSVAVYGKNGKLDRTATLNAFGEQLDDWAERQKNISPAVIQVLTDYPRLGEGRLIDFVTHSLRMDPGQETRELVQAVLVELEKAGKIAYKTTENGERRGRGAGYALANGQASAPTEVPTGKSSKPARGSVRANA